MRKRIPVDFGFACLVLIVSGCATGTAGPGPEDAAVADPEGPPDAVEAADPSPADASMQDADPVDPADATDRDATAADESSWMDDAVNPVYAPFRIRVVESLSPADGSSYAFAYVESYGGTEEIPSQEVARSGECVVRAPVWDPPCEPPCVWPEHCDVDAKCVAFAKSAEAGTIRVQGLKSALTLVPETQYHYYTAQFDPEPAGDLFDAGATVTAFADGGLVPAFTLSVKGVPSLEIDLACPTPLPATGPLVLSWTPDPSQPPQTVSLRIAGMNHATQFVRIDCESPDDGEVSVDRALLDLYLADWHPAGTIWSVERMRAVRDVVDGFDVRLEVSGRTGCRFVEPVS